MILLSLGEKDNSGSESSPEEC